MATSSNSIGSTGIGSISSAGIGSGLDVSSIITKLMSVEKAPLNLLQDQAGTLGTELSGIGKIQSYFSSLASSVNTLVNPTLWSGTTASSSDNSAATVSTGSGSTAGNYSLAVARLASSQSVTSSALASASSTLSAGTLTIELGSWTGATNGQPPTGFSPKAGSSAVTIDIGAGDTSLSAIRDKINASGAGVTASIVNDATGARLSIRSRDTGEENAFRIGVSETTDDGNAATGLSSLAYDAMNASSGMVRSIEAGNAQATLNGIAISSASNTLTNVVDGLTLTLKKATTSGNPVEIGVATDTTSIQNAITGLVNSFNNVAGYIHMQTAYDPGSKTGGALQGDQGVLSLQSQLRAVINQGSTASSTYSRLTEIGIAMQSDGTLKIDSTKLGNALAGDVGELKKLFATDGNSAADSGFARRFKRLSDAALTVGGTFETRTQSLQASIKRNSDAQDSMQLRLNQTEARLRRQYTALDTTMSTLSALSSYVSQQVTNWNKSSN